MTICHTCSDGKERGGEKVYERKKNRKEERKIEREGEEMEGGTKTIRG